MTQIGEWEEKWTRAREQRDRQIQKSMQRINRQIDREEKIEK